MNTIEIASERTLREIVTENSASAAVLEKYGLDYCCRGGSTLREACAAKGLDSDRIGAELAEVPVDESSQRHFQWEIPFLADYIVNNHHAYVKSQIPLIALHLSKVVNAHGDRHPEVHTVDAIFSEHAQSLLDHMDKEEHILFPYMKSLFVASQNGGAPPRAPFGSVAGPVAVMLAEHEGVGEAFEQIRDLLDNYTPPADGCTTMRLLYRELDAFEHDLHKHVFLENSILFPKAIRLEEESLRPEAVPSH